ncbi:hypothetical protein [Xanthobacter sp. 126]|uniref:DUF6968 family protein n=1 Tax=Xanthobacter sp. 126 TaxID=1131814 RepID=UPI00045EBC21|nr:hypothetical protein [Xanthobacter sp. 126]
MLILTHTLHLNRPSGKVPIEIRLYQPLPTGASWICNFEIDWPEVRLARHGVGEDALQALVIALQMIGAQIYTSPYHEDGSLRAPTTARTATASPSQAICVTCSSASTR